MTVSIEEDIQLLTEEGYLSEEEAKREAFRALLRERPDLRTSLAVERYKRGGVTLNRGAEIAGVTTEEFKRILADRGVSIRRGGSSEEDRERRARELGRGGSRGRSGGGDVDLEALLDETDPIFEDLEDFVEETRAGYNPT